ncbi:MAG: PQQ-like beta-propeller repeat protein [Bacteroidales bacterium]|jgi:outer membrane protein assembly factor BamB|nr:PQQ-like beta-propeller repeat protein [Bacteroidales bacterium]
MSKIRCNFFILVLLTISISAGCNAQSNHSENDWSQWMGKDRKGIWHLDLMKESLDVTDLVKKWEVAVGTGYCGPTVYNGKVYVMDFVNEKERVLCFDAETGNQLWIHTYTVDYSVGYPTGPRASVIIEDELAYSFGTMGAIYCLNAVTGEVIWSVDGDKAYDLDMPIWGLAASPLIEKEQLIVQMGGKPDACLVAFDKKNGKEMWRALSDEASYAAPIVIEQAGERVLVCWTGDNLAGLDPESGEVFWKVPYIRRKDVINISTPVYSPPYIFLSSFYDGSMLVRLDNKKLSAELVWNRAGESERKTDALHCIISTPLIQGNYVYGVDSYGEFRCLDLMTGDRIWTDSTLVPYGRWANAHFVTQDDKIWAFNEKGELILGRISSKGFNELGRTKLIKPVKVSPNPRGGVNWAFPAFNGRRIYARSDGALVCYELVK